MSLFHQRMASFWFSGVPGVHVSDYLMRALTGINSPLGLPSLCPRGSSSCAILSICLNFFSDFLSDLPPIQRFSVQAMLKFLKTLLFFIRLWYDSIRDGLSWCFVSSRACFVTYDVIYFGEDSMFCWVECVYSNLMGTTFQSYLLYILTDGII